MNKGLPTEGLTIEHDRETDGKIIFVSGPMGCGKTTYIAREIAGWEACGVVCAHVVVDRDGMRRVDAPPDRRDLKALAADRSIGRIYVERLV